MLQVNFSVAVYENKSPKILLTPARGTGKFSCVLDTMTLERWKRLLFPSVRCSFMYPFWFWTELYTAHISFLLITAIPLKWVDYHVTCVCFHLCLCLVFHNWQPSVTFVSLYHPLEESGVLLPHHFLTGIDIEPVCHLCLRTYIRACFRF